MRDTTVSGLWARGFCTVCGAPFVPPAAFCAACGAPSGERPPDQPPERDVRADTLNNQAPVTITITPAQFWILVPVVGLVAGLVVGQYVAGNLLVSVLLALVGCFLGYAIALRAPGGSFERALHEAAANVGSSVRVLVEPLRVASTGSPVTGRPSGVRADLATGVPASGPDPASAWPPTVGAYSQATAVRPTAAPITTPTVVRAVAAVALLGALLLPWIGVSASYSGSGASYSLNGLGMGSYSASAGEFGVSGGGPGLGELREYVPLGLGSVLDVLRLLPLLAAVASVALLVVLAVAYMRPDRRLRVGTLATLAGLAAIVAAGAWFVVISILDGIVSVASPDLGIALAFAAGLVLLASGLHGRRRLTPVTVIPTPTEQRQQAYRRLT